VLKDAIVSEEGQQLAFAGNRPLGTAALSLLSTTLDKAPDSLLAEWRAFCSSSPSPMHNPDWLNGYFDEQRSNLLVYALFQSESLSGVAPFLRRDWPLKWHLGEWCVATFPLKRLRLLGGPLAFPENEMVCDLLFRRVLSDGGFDALYLEEIPVDSFFWKYLHSSKLIRDSFLVYQPDTVSPHPILRIERTFEQYMSKFSSKHRNTLQRKVKKLREGALGEMHLVRYESPIEVTTFLDRAVEISRKTYQWQLHQRGLSATDLLQKRLQFAAEHGWMRCYLLFCGERAVAFIVGYQYRGTFLLDEIGHDPEWSKYSAGAVLQLLTVEDLFNYNRARIFDLQDYARYKDELSNENYMQGRVFLFRRGVYSRFISAGHRVCSAITVSASASLERIGLKSKVRKLIRRFGTSQFESPTT
jgi:CelD/BcsL family acetyltransferase involved in cellulose biosynthesis